MQLNTPLPDFKLKGTDNRLHSTADFHGKDAVVIIFTCNHCPYARAYVSRIAALADEYAKHNMGFYAINSNDPMQYPEDSFENMLPMSEALHLNGNYLFDESQEVAKTFGAQRTPEIFLFNKDKKLSYHGAIDDNWQFPAEVKTYYLKNALEALLSGKDVPDKTTQAVGCSVKWKK